MAIAYRRIIDQLDDTELQSGDYIMVDSETEGTRKYDLGAGMSGKVDKVAGKGLSTEDYTTAEKTKLSEVEVQANKTIIDATLTNTGQAADAKKVGGELSAVKADLEEIETTLETKAEIDGYYEDMTVGDAEQIVSTQFVEDSVPYLYRTSGGSADIGNREYDEIVGGSIVWNQLVDGSNLPATQTINGVTFTNNGDGSITVNGTATALARLDNVVSSRTWVAHKYLLIGCPSGGSVSTYSLALRGQGWDIYETGNGIIWDASRNAYKGMCIYVQNGTKITTPIKFKPQFIDLTQMLGSSVADYLYTLDSATAGAGIAKLKSWGFLHKDYYEYNAGEMMHVSGISAHEMVGFNQWDEEWEVGEFDGSGVKRARSNAIRSANYIPCFPATTYYWECASHATVDGVLNFYDENQAFISRTIGTLNKTFTTPTNAHYMTFYVAPETTYNNDICINLHWSGTRDGEYEPYVKRSYSLDPTVTLRGIPKTDASENLYYDGDIWHPDGTVTRRYGIVDLTDESTYASVSVGTSTAGIQYADVFFLTNKRTVNNTRNVFSTKYSRKDVNSTGESGSFKAYANNITIFDSRFTDVATAKSLLSSEGVKFVYILATPTTETATPYRSLQKVDPYGTEEYVSTSLVPVGHYTKYPENLKAKIENLDLSMIAPIETGTTASQAYAVGKYFLLNNKFCKAKTAIASGATFTLNTNYEVTTIADELYTALNA